MKIHECEQGSAEWHRLRSGIPTASEFGLLVTSTGAASRSLEDYALQLAAERYAGKELDRFSGNRSTERGKAIEAQARRWYEFQTDSEVRQVGFITDGAENYGASPDGLVGDDGMIEIKCLTAKRHVEALVYVDKNQRAPPAYIPQTQGEMLVCERSWNDLVFYHPELPSIVVRQVPIAAVRRGLIEQIRCVISRRNRVLRVLYGC